VVGGWTLAYAIKSVTGALASNDPKVLGAAFGTFIADPLDVIGFHTAFMVLTLVIVAGGVRHGIERAARILMPILALLVIVLAVRAVTLDGAAKGIAFFLTPDFSKVTWNTVNAALGQAFFSLSLGMGTMITYASYLDTGFAVIAGLMILPAVFAFGFDPAAGPGLTFITLPAVFAQMPAGALFSFLFFILLAIAALTSAVSIIEPVVSYLIDERKLSRRTATWGAGAVIWALGVPSALSLGPWKDITIGGKGILDAVDYLASNIMLPLGGILIALFVGWSVAARAVDEAQSGGDHPFALARVWIFICRFVAPAAVAWVMISGL
jgi:NSS family neurotransmitter:Na+ symporter